MLSMMPGAQKALKKQEPLPVRELPGSTCCWLTFCPLPGLQ